MPLFVVTTWQMVGLMREQLRMGEFAGKVMVGLDGLHDIGHGACQAEALAALDPRHLTDGYDLDGDCTAAVAYPLDAQLVDAWILGVKKLGRLDPGRVGDIRHPERETGVVCLEHNTTIYDKSPVLR